tara:strand:+ start:20864 stop:21337 length:474 start_codon:yes stop_codon:yes gene_type:complete
MIKVRQAATLDISRIVDLLWDDEQGRVRESLSDAAMPKYQQAFEAIENDPNCNLLVAVEDEIVVGCIQINVLSGLSYQGIRRGLIEDLRVARASRGKGYGRLLVDAASDHAIAQGCEMIELFVHQDREKAQAFYQACGFQGHHKGYRRHLRTASPRN